MDLKTRTTMKNCGIYQLTPKEAEALKEYITEVIFTFPSPQWPALLFVLGDTTLFQQIKSSQEYDKEVSQALEVIFKNGLQSLTNESEEWNLDDGIILNYGKLLSQEMTPYNMK